MGLACRGMGGLLCLGKARSETNLALRHSRGGHPSRLCCWRNPLPKKAYRPSCFRCLAEEGSEPGNLLPSIRATRCQGRGIWMRAWWIHAGVSTLQRHLGRILLPRASEDCIAKVPLADWIPRQGNDPHDALTKLTDEINQQLGRRLSLHVSDATLQLSLVVGGTLLASLDAGCRWKVTEFIRRASCAWSVAHSQGQYAEGYEEAQHSPYECLAGLKAVARSCRLAVRLVDFLVAKSGCDILRQEAAASALEQPGKWNAMSDVAEALAVCLVCRIVWI